MNLIISTVNYFCDSWGKILIIGFYKVFLRNILKIKGFDVINY